MMPVARLTASTWGTISWFGKSRYGCTSGLFPDFQCAYPFGVIRVPDVLPVTDAVSVLDLRNYRQRRGLTLALSDADTIRDVWPDGLHSVSEMIQHPVRRCSVPPPADHRATGRWWITGRNNGSTSEPTPITADPPAPVHTAHTWNCNYWPCCATANWSNVDNIRKMDAAKWGAFDYAELSGSENPISAHLCQPRGLLV